MNIYAINVCTDTKNTDRYETVAVNKYPVIVVGTNSELVNYLRSEDMKKFIKELFRTQNLYDAGVFRIRIVDTQYYDVTQDELSVKDFVKLEYK